MAYDLITMGEILMRLSPLPQERMYQTPLFRHYFGGAEMNVAAAAASLGLDTAVLTRLPANAFGENARQWMGSLGISNAFCLEDSRKNARLGMYYYEPRPFPAQPKVVYDREGTSMRSLAPSDLPGNIFHEARCFHTSGITLGLGGSCKMAAVEAIRRFKAAGALISFDVNYRMNLWSGQEARACIKEILPLVDIFFCSEDTMRLTFQKTGSLKEMMASFTEDYPIKIVAATQRTVHSPQSHSFGSVIYHGALDRYFKGQAYGHIPVVDRIGSGDAYVGGVLAGLLRPGRSWNVPETIQEAMDWGNGCAALKMGVQGDVLKTDVDELAAVVYRHYEGSSMEMER